MVIFKKWVKRMVGRTAKRGVNDLSQWEAFGGVLKRPAPPSPMTPRRERA